MCHAERSEASDSGEILRYAQDDEPEFPQWLEGRCLSYGGSIAYLLWLDVLRGLLGVTVEDSPERLRDILRERLEALCGEKADRYLPYLARMMSVTLDAGTESQLRDLDGQQLKANTFDAVEALLTCAAGGRPLAIVLEDMHWADPTSLELLERLLALTDRASVLFICVFRPQPEHGSWRIRETAARSYEHRHTDLRLRPLSNDESATLLSNLMGLPTLANAFRERVLRHAEGNPFYVEEIIRALIGSRAVVRDDAGRWQLTQDVDDLPIPETLQGVLLARIDRLHEDTKHILQMAAVIGRSFLYRLLTAIAHQEKDLDQQLVLLQREQMIRERARIPELEYIFKHHLTQEAAYNGLLKKERRALHRQVAEALEDLFPERIEEQLGLLAHHWERAQEVGKATEYLRRAGDHARLAYANEEAISYYRRALALLEPALPGEQPAVGQAGAARIYESLGDVLALTGHRGEARQAYGQAMAGAPGGDLVWQARLQRRIGTAWDEENRWQEAEQAYSAAEAALGPEAPDSALEWWREWLAIQHRRIWLCYGLTRLDEMSALAKHCRPAVEKYGTPLQRGEFFQGLTMLGLRVERYAVSEETLEYSKAALSASLESEDPVQIADRRFELGFASMWHGDLDEAEQMMLSALEQTERTGDVAVLSRVLTYLTVLYRMRGQIDRVKLFAARSLALATDRQMVEYVGMAKASLAWLAWREGRWAEAKAYGRVAVEMWQQAPLSTPFQWTARWPLLAVAMAQADISGAMDHAQAMLEPEQHCLPPALTVQLEQAAAAWQKGDNAAAGACLSQALELAQQLGFL
jgi:tetratricopeptide (TPR) repeat protein